MRWSVWLAFAALVPSSRSDAAQAVHRGRRIEQRVKRVKRWPVHVLHPGSSKVFIPSNVAL